MKLDFKLILLGMILLVPEVYALTAILYTYDANGNLTSGDGKYYEYDDANKLVRVRHGDASGPVIVEYFYDYNGQRVKKIENGVTTYYIGKHYEQQVTDTSQTHTSYYFANGERVVKKDDSGNLSYFHSDHLGGTNAISDSTGNLIEKTTYYPFGEIRQGGSEKYAYTGKEKDKLTDWYYYEARYYNDGFEHFTQADTFAPDLYDPQALNRYAYVRNNPLKFIDPTGHVSLNPKDWYKASKEKLASLANNTKQRIQSAKEQINHYLFDPLPQDSNWVKFDNFMRNEVNPYMIKGTIGSGITVPTIGSHIQQSHSISLTFDGRYGTQTPASLNYSLSAGYAAKGSLQPSFNGISTSFKMADDDSKTSINVSTPLKGLDINFENKGIELDFFGTGTPDISISREVFSKELIGISR